MSHSTTATSSYILTKYSRSYPSKLETQSDVALSDWQHFTNPVIQLVLDTKKSRKGELESVRLRILWKLESDETGESANVQPPVVFEDLDLLVFSSVANNPPQRQNSQGLPLKAVYRDTVVGIRYLHPRDNPTSPMYRRFQVSFQSPNTVSEFINSIKTVCPCKWNQNPQAPALNASATMTNTQLPFAPHSFRSETLTHPGIGLPLLVHGSSSTSTQIQLPRYARQPARLPFPSSPDLRISSGFQSNIPSSMNVSSNSSPPNSSQFQVMGPPSIVPKPNLCTGSSIHPESNEITQTPSLHPNAGATQASLPSSSPLPSSSDHNTGVTAGGTNVAANPPSTVDFVAALREATSIYNLPSSTLEQLVGEVVREDGFVNLLEQLSTMWRVRSLAQV